MNTITKSIHKCYSQKMINTLNHVRTKNRQHISKKIGKIEGRNFSWSEWKLLREEGLAEFSKRPSIWESCRGNVDGKDTRCRRKGGKSSVQPITPTLLYIGTIVLMHVGAWIC